MAKNGNNGNGNDKIYWKYNPLIDLYCYDSALRLGQMVSQYGTSKAYLELAPRYEDAPEKPKAGDKVYNHDDRIFISLGIPQLTRLHNSLTTLCCPELSAEGGCYKAMQCVITQGIFEISVGRGEWLEKPEPNTFFINIRNKDTDYGVGFMFENAPLTFDVEERKDKLVIPSVQNLDIFIEWLWTQRTECLKVHAPATKPQQQQNGGFQNSGRGAVSNNKFRKPNTSSQGANSSAAPYEPQGADEDMPF
jgi:hypothetical protein